VVPEFRLAMAFFEELQGLNKTLKNNKRRKKKMNYNKMWRIMILFMSPPVNTK